MQLIMIVISNNTEDNDRISNNTVDNDCNIKQYSR